MYSYGLEACCQYYGCASCPDGGEYVSGCDPLTRWEREQEEEKSQMYHMWATGEEEKPMYKFQIMQMATNLIEELLLQEDNDFVDEIVHSVAFGIKYDEDEIRAMGEKEMCRY